MKAFNILEIYKREFITSKKNGQIKDRVKKISLNKNRATSLLIKNLKP